MSHVRSLAAPGLSKIPGVIHQGNNSGYQIIDLAAQFGVRRILLLGYDMQKTGGKAHWFGDHPAKLKKPSPYGSWIANFDTLARDARERGIEIINCSRETALECFPRATIGESFRSS